MIVAGRRQHLLEELAARHQGMEGIAVDITGTEAVAAFTAEVCSRFPDLNVLVNNAGISRPEDLTAEDVDISISRAIVWTNVLSVLEVTAALCCRRYAPSRRRPS